MAEEVSSWQRPLEGIEVLGCCCALTKTKFGYIFQMCLIFAAFRTYMLDMIFCIACLVMSQTLNQVCHDGFLLASSILITGLLITAVGCLNEFHITRFTQTQPCVCVWISILWCFDCSRLPPYQSRKACHGTGDAICCKLVILNVCSCVSSFYI